MIQLSLVCLTVGLLLLFFGLSVSRRPESQDCLWGLTWCVCLSVCGIEISGHEYDKKCETKSRYEGEREREKLMEKCGAFFWERRKVRRRRRKRGKSP